MQYRSPSFGDSDIRREPPGLSAIGVFLVFGAVMAGLAGTTMLWPGTALDRIWVLNPTAYAQLALRGRAVGILFMLLGTALAFAGTGWFRRRLWGWRLAAAIIATQVLGDLVNCIRGNFWRGGVGFLIAGALLFYLLRPKVKAAFANGTVSSPR